jgi:methyl-accepting chemotaxis protein
VKLSLRTKIYGLVTLLVCGLAGTTGLLLYEFDRTARQDAEFAHARLQLQNDVRVVQITFKKQVQSWKDILLRGSDPESLAKYKAEFFRLEAEVDQRARSLKLQIDDPSAQAGLDDFLAAHATLGRDYRTSLAQFEQSEGKDFAASDSLVKGKDRPPTEAIDSIVEELGRQTEQAQERNAQKLSTMLRATAAAAVVLNLSLLALGVYVARSIAKSTADLTSHLAVQADDMRQGKADLTNIIPVSTEDEFGEIARSFNTFVSAIREIMLRLSSYSEQLAGASEEISAGAKLSSQAAGSQSQQVQQAAVAIQEMSATGQEISQNSQSAAGASREAAESARDGGKVVEATLASMRNIADSSRNAVSRIAELGKNSEKIGKIVAVIDEIADQTNMLALNAAIEAARAGEQGRGFAVVADEVRKLAERTTRATREIAAMIGSIQSETKHAVEAMEVGNRDVEQGVEKTSASGATLRELIRKSDHVGNMVSQIATAASQQAIATEQIHNSVAGISSSIQQSASAAVQTSKACSELSDLAVVLRTMVGNFKLGATSGLLRETPGNDPRQFGSSKARAAGAGN